MMSTKNALTALPSPTLAVPALIAAARDFRVYSFARVGAALAMKVEDVFVQKRRLWVRLREKGGKHHEMPCHHNLGEYLTAFPDALGLHDDPNGPLFRTIPHRGANSRAPP
jgi:integrase